MQVESCTKKINKGDPRLYSISEVRAKEGIYRCETQSRGIWFISLVSSSARCLLWLNPENGCLVNVSAEWNDLDKFSKVDDARLCMEVKLGAS